MTVNKQLLAGEQRASKESFVPRVCEFLRVHRRGAGYSGREQILGKGMVVLEKTSSEELTVELSYRNDGKLPSSQWKKSRDRLS